MNAWRPSGVSSPNIHSANLSAALSEKLDELSKSEKLRLQQAILQQMAMVRGNLKKAKWKKDINAGNTQLRKLERQLKKVK